LEKEDKVTYSIIIPCYNEEKAIEVTIKDVRKHLEGLPYELIIVNDGSSDETLNILQQIMTTDLELRVESHDINRGYGAALKTGIRRAKGDYIGITDADCTYPNERLPELMLQAKKTDMVVGSRTADDVVYPLIRKIPKVFLRRYASWIAGKNIPDINSGLRVFKKSLALKYLTILPDGFSFTTTITLVLLTNHYQVIYEPIGYTSRVGQSKIKPIRDTIKFVELILRTGMYFAPLKVLMPFVYFLFICFSISLGYDSMVLKNLTDKTVILFMFMMNTAMFALLADMIDKRT